LCDRFSSCLVPLTTFLLCLAAASKDSWLRSSGQCREKWPFSPQL
jgi:hypothetical protein